MVYLAAAATACLAFDIGPGFLRLSNYELVKSADDVVLAQTLGAHARDKDMVRFQVKTSLKGIYDDKELIAYGSLDPEHYYGPSRPGDFSRARPGTGSGMGSAHDFMADKLYLLFLGKRPVWSGLDRELWGKQVVGEKVWVVGVQPLSRDREEISGPDDPWLRTVRIYVKIAGLRNYDLEKQRLRAVVAQGNDEGRDLPVGIVDDIVRHFATVSPMKSYTDLMTFRKDGVPQPQRQQVLYAFAQGHHPEAFDLVRRETSASHDVGTLLEYLLGVDHPDRVTALVELVPLLRSEDLKRDALQGLLQADAPVREDQVLSLMEQVDPADFSGELVASWIAIHPTDKTIRDLRERVGDAYDKCWRMSQALAHLGDAGMLAWAVKALDTDRYIRAVYAIGYCPTDEALSVSKAIIASGDRERIQILRYALKAKENRNPNRNQLLRLLPSAGEH
jgi:hypothetical protein